MRRPLLALAVPFLLFAASCSDSSPTAYGPEVEENFTHECRKIDESSNSTLLGSNSAEDVCSCAYAAIVDTIAFEDFKQIDDDLGDADDEASLEAALPGTVADILVSCIADPS